MTYEFDVFGTLENKELTRFARWVETKYNNVTGEELAINFNGIVAIALLNTKRQLTPAKLEKSRFLLENEFAKHFQKVKVVAFLQKPHAPATPFPSGGEKVKKTR